MHPVVAIAPRAQALNIRLPWRCAQVFFKVLRDFDGRRYAQYANHPAQPFIILDGEHIPHRMEECPCGCETMEVTDVAIAKMIHAHTNTLIYHDGELWAYHPESEGEWVVII